ncbi:MAG: sulfur oxidation c-type cytochrome SoxA, partial [Methyloligellaceae bacterium]
MRLVSLICAALFMTVLVSANTASAADGKNAALKPAVKDHPLTELWSGYHYAKKETREMQDDDFANPAMTWYDIGEENWSKTDGEAGKACAECHKPADDSMKGIGARYPI